jgi:transposase
MVMAQQRLSMRKIRELLRLKFEQGLSERKIAIALSVSRAAVSECVQRTHAAGLRWPLPDEMDDAQLEARLYPVKSAVISIPLPDFSHIHRELQRKGVTRHLLWQEYQAQHPDGLQYSAFCDRYRIWLAAHVEPVMRFEHRAGDKLFVDYAGHTMDVMDRYTGEIKTAQIFVAVLGCSNYTFVEATWSQTLPDWLGSHVRALNFFGGMPAAIVPDNLKSGVVKAHRYDPEINPAYAEFAEHYQLTILPARVRKPRDKAKVEGAVLSVERSILAKLRNQQFFALSELNAAIATLLFEYNHKSFQKLDGSRHTRFVELDQPVLKPLPARAYEYAQWKCAKVHLDYHIEVDHACYSVPHQHIGHRVDVRSSARMIEIFYQRQLIATHLRLYQRGQRVTLAAHRPERHRAHIDQSIERLIERAQQMDACVAQVLREQFHKKTHPEEALRSAQGILRMAQDFSVQQLIAACQQAVILKTASYRSIKHLITAAQGAVHSTAVRSTAVRSTTESDEPRQLLLMHDNVRGSDYFH